MPLHPKDFSDALTEPNAPPHGYATRFARHPLRISWTDSRGPQSRTITQRAVIGSAANADVVIADPAVSKLHADVDPRDDGVWIRDLGSRNGTFVQGILVREGCVPEGGIARIGSTSVSMTREPGTTEVELWPDDHFGDMVGGSAIMRELFATLARVAPTDSSVLVQGETGTGKELVARAIHEKSLRSANPFVVVDCAALPETLLESELFGHARGAFTGAVNAREGVIEAADGGTVFLDEIGEVPLAVQPKLLRVLEARTVRRVGETQHRPVDARFIAATHRNLRQMVNAGAFREDLYFRLSVLPVVVPPLRERLDDIPLLLRAILKGNDVQWPAATFIAELMHRPWLGNVRELRSFVDRAVVFGAKKALSMSPTHHDEAPQNQADPALVSIDRPLKDAREAWMDHFEREYLRKLLERHDRNVPAAAQAAGVHRTYIYRLIMKHGL